MDEATSLANFATMPSRTRFVRVFTWINGLAVPVFVGFYSWHLVDEGVAWMSTLLLTAYIATVAYVITKRKKSLRRV